MKTPRTTIPSALCGQWPGIAASALVAAATAAAAAQPATINVRTIVRDFQPSHPDFNLPSGPVVPVAGNVDLTLDSYDDPVYAGAGAAIATDWRERASNPIAPHMYRDAGGGGAGAGEIAVTTTPSLTDQSSWDTYNSSLGPYGPGNKGGAPSFAVGAPMPTLSEPTGLPPKVALYKPSGTISADVHCDVFDIKEKTVRVSGDVTILCETSFKVYTQARLQINPGSSLTVYVKGAFRIYDETSAGSKNGSSDPEAFTIINLGTQPIEILDQASKVYANIISPDAPLRVIDQAAFYGGFIGHSAVVGNQAAAHFDTSWAFGAGPALDSCGNALNDTPGVWGVANDGRITSDLSFNQWFKSTPGVNISAVRLLAFTGDGVGTFEHTTDDYTPINDALFGNDYFGKNRNFTMEFSVDFVHDACAGGFFEYEGDGEVWVFIDGQLVIDLAGPQVGRRQYIDVDRLDLNDGQSYTLSFFYAQRQPVPSPFSIRTSLDIVPRDFVTPTIALAD